AADGAARAARRAPAGRGGGLGVHELEDFEDVAEDLRCCVCQEGYHFQPEEVLCVYIFVKPVAVQAAQVSPEPRAEGEAASYRVAPRFGMCSVSHLTVIHWHCHQSATRAAADMRKPQGEWESATVRNSSSKCNALVPVLGPSLPDAAASRALERHFAHLAQLAKGHSQSVLSRRAACLLQDLRLCFVRMACQESFSVDTGGGGPRHNMCVALVKLQLLTCEESLAGDLANELGELESNVIAPMLDFGDPAEAGGALERYKPAGQAESAHPGHLWAHCALAAALRAATPGGGAGLEWSAGTIWRLLALALEVTRQHGAMKWDLRRGPGSPRGSPQSAPPGSPRWPPQSPG
ncbi:unnamed protein product, partial [Prorocentrum cordatum]